MILNQNQQSDAQLIGDIQNNKVGIDTNNLDFITSLLTTNLYSQPIQSFIRETVANGWDSHVEAGTTDKPVILRIYTDTRGYIHLAVRDYGTGLSLERFNEIYLNIGSSTKRSSNDYIGMFGIGRFSALSVSNTVHLTNYYQGVCSKYIMYKDAGKICIDKLFESETQEESGLEVDVATDKQSHNSYELRNNIAAGIKQLTFYNNIYVDDSEGLITLDNYTNCKDFNNRKIADFKTFKVCSHEEIRNCILMGNVLYPIDSNYIEKWFKGISQVPFAIKCNIGDVDITPSRETLLYSQKTINTIDTKCKEALKEFKEIAKTTFGSDFKTIEQYYNFSNSGYIPITLKEFVFGEFKIAATVEIPMKEMSYYDLSDKVTICGQKIPSDLLQYYKNFRYTSMPSLLVTYEYCSNRFHVKNKRLSFARYMEDYYPKGRVRLIDEPLKPTSKRYWANNHNDQWNIFYFLNRKYIYYSFRRLLKEFCDAYKTTPTNPTIKFIFKDFITNYTDVKSYNNWDVPQDFIDAEKLANKISKGSTQQKARKCVIYKLIEGRSWNTIGYDTNAYSLESLSKFRGTVFFAEKDDSYLEAFYRIITRLGIDNVILVSVAPTNLPLLRNIKNCIELTTIFTEKNKLISKICTNIYLTEKWGISRSGYYFDELDEKTGEFFNLYKLINRLSRYKNIIEYNDQIVQELLKSLCTTYYNNGWLNYRMINLLETNLEYVKLNHWFCNNSDFKEVIFAFYEYITKHNISNKERFDRIKNTLKPIFNEYTPNTELSHFNIG